MTETNTQDAKSTEDHPKSNEEASEMAEKASQSNSQVLQNLLTSKSDRNVLKKRMF